MEASVLAELKEELKRMAEQVSRPGAGPAEKMLYQKLMERVLAESGADKYLQVGGPSAENPAIVTCAAAYNEVYLRFMQSRRDKFEALKAGRAAWLTTLPPLTGPDSIRDFIACVAYGMATDVIQPEKGARLLYAAQTALTLESQLNRRPAGRPATTPGNEPDKTAPAETVPAQTALSAMETGANVAA